MKMRGLLLCLGVAAAMGPDAAKFQRQLDALQKSMFDGLQQISQNFAEYQTAERRRLQSDAADDSPVQSQCLASQVVALREDIDSMSCDCGNWYRLRPSDFQ